MTDVSTCFIWLGEDLISVCTETLMSDKFFMFYITTHTTVQGELQTKHRARKTN